MPQAGLMPSNTAIQSELPPRGDISVRWEGSVEPEASGDYQFQTYSNGGLKTLGRRPAGGRPLAAGLAAVVRPGAGAPGGRPAPRAAARLGAGRQSAGRAAALENAGGRLRHVALVRGGRGRSTTISSTGRISTGSWPVTAASRAAAPMMPQWVFRPCGRAGSATSTAQESLDVVKGFRSRGIPFDNIVQDWFYWKADAWGSHEFDPARFPDPAGLDQGAPRRARAADDLRLAEILSRARRTSRRCTRAASSTSATCRRTSTTGSGFPTRSTTPSIPEARKLFWAQIDRELFRKHVDAWWLDATEPDLTRGPTLDGQRDYMNPTALGPGSRRAQRVSAGELPRRSTTASARRRRTSGSSF